MRMVFGIISLLLVVAVMAILTKKQLSSTVLAPVMPQSSSVPGAAPPETQLNQPQNSIEQSQQLQQQVQQQLKQAMEAGAQSRAQAEDK